MRFANRQELADKVDVEGGVIEALYYGITVDDFPIDTPGSVIDAWRRLEASEKDIDAVTHWLETGESLESGLQ